MRAASRGGPGRGRGGRLKYAVRGGGEEGSAGRGAVGKRGRERLEPTEGGRRSTLAPVSRSLAARQAYLGSYWTRKPTWVPCRLRGRLSP